MISLKSLIQKCDAATPGPWNIQLVDSHETCWLDGETAEKPPTIHDLNYIDAANPATVRALCGALQKAGKALAMICMCGVTSQECSACMALKELCEVISE